MPVIDLGDCVAWPQRFSEVANGIATEVHSRTDVGPDCFAQDLPQWDRRFSEHAELALREAMSGHRIATYHASRLLDHELEEIVAHGLRVCSDELASEKLAAAAREYPHLLPAEALGRVREAGPLVWQRGALRRGLLWVVTPKRALATLGGFGRLFGRWGGEVISWTDDDESPERPAASVIDALSAVSRPSLVTVAVEPSEIPAERPVWPLVVATLLGLEGGCAEWPLTTSLGADRVLGIAHPGVIPAAWD